MRLIADFIAFSPDGKSYVTRINNGPLAVYDTASGQEVRRFEFARYPTPVAARYSPNGKTVAWLDFNFGWQPIDLAHPIKSSAERVLWGAAEFSPDGSALAGCSYFVPVHSAITQLIAELCDI